MSFSQLAHEVIEPGVAELLPHIRRQAARLAERDSRDQRTGGRRAGARTEAAERAGVGGVDHAPHAAPPPAGHEP